MSFEILVSLAFIGIVLTLFIGATVYESRQRKKMPLAQVEVVNISVRPKRIVESIRQTIYEGGLLR